MDPAEAGDWLSGRPKQLVFLTGLDPANKKSHKTLTETFTTRSPSSLPLNLRLVRGELDLPGKRALASDKGIIRNDWPLKYLDKVPALIVLFLDLDWDHASWAEKRTEAESKCASIRASCRQGSRLAVVLLQERTSPTPADDPLATERAHDLCNACQLSPRQLFVVPMLCNDLHGYINRLEGAFHELAQGFYQQKLRAIRARSIPNNTPSLIVRQLFKLAFLSELRQDTHTALRNYRLAYEQCKESLDQWEDSNIFEWRSIVGLLNYKWCELSFLHSTAVESINQMRKHQQNFFNMKPSNYPTPQLASIEHQLWKARQCYNFAKLFEKAVADGLTALPTLNPGAHLELAATIYSQAHNEIAQLKQVTPSTPYPSPDPLAPSPVFLGQRPWRVGYETLATPEVEQFAVTALLQRLIVNHAGVIDLLSAAMNQYKRYECTRMQLKVVNEMAGVYYTSGDMPKALQLWCFAIEGLPRTVRQFVLQKAIWAAYTTAAVKDFVWCCLQLCPKEPETAKALTSILAGIAPNAPYRYDLGPEQESKIEQLWTAALSEKHEFTLNMQKVDSCFQVEASFLKFDQAEQSERIPVLLKLTSSALCQATISRVVIHFGTSSETRPLAAPLRAAVDAKSELTCEINNIVLEPQFSTTYVCQLELSKAALHDLETIDISKVVLELTSNQGNLRALLVNDSSSKKRPLPCGSTSLKFGRQSGGIEADGELKVSCLVGEVAKATLQLKNTTSRPVQDLRLEFNRNTQSSMAGSAVIFVDDSNDLRSELIIPIACPSTVEIGQTIFVPIRFSAQLVGDMELCLEASHLVPGETQRRISKLRLSVCARDPFTISSQIMTMNGIPVDALLNHNEHILKADIRSNADIVVTRIEWLLADVVTAVHHDEQNSKSVEEDLSADDVISFCKAVAVSSTEEDVETPLGRLAVEWKRVGSETAVRSVSALCRLPVIGCPVTVAAKVDNAPSVVRQAIKIQYTLTNTTEEVIDLTATFDFMENFMYCGDKKVNFRLLPARSRQIDIVVMALTGGRLMFPCPALKSATISDALLQQSLRSLPASLFVLPRSKDGISSDA